MVNIKSNRSGLNSSDTSIEIVREKNVDRQVDAIFNITNFYLSDRDVFTEIYRAGGPALELRFRQLIPPKIGEATITPGYNLLAKWIVHSCAPIWEDGVSGKEEDIMLARCYRHSLAICRTYEIETIVIPGIETGLNSFPLERGSQIAIAEIQRFIRANNFLKKVIFVCSSESEYQVYQNALLLRIWQIPIPKTEQFALDSKAFELKKIKRILSNKDRNNELKVSCVKTALRHGNDGIKLLFKILKTEQGELQYLAYDLLWEKATERGKKRLVSYFPWPSQVGMDYSKLRNLLLAEKWQEADLETRKLMLAVTGANLRTDRLLTQKDIENFPAIDLLSINEIWVRYSSGKFGFSVIKNLYDRAEQDYTKLASQVGWLLKNNWLKYEDLTFTNQAPKGHLPIAWLVPISFSDYWIARFARVGWNLIFDRLESCGINEEDND